MLSKAVNGIRRGFLLKINRVIMNVISVKLHQNLVRDNARLVSCKVILFHINFALN